MPCGFSEWDSSSLIASSSCGKRHAHAGGGQARCAQAGERHAYRNDLADHAPHWQLVNEDLIPVMIRHSVRQELGAIRVDCHLAGYSRRDIDCKEDTSAGAAPLLVLRVPLTTV